MVRKITVIGIALIGISLAFGGSAWADRNRGDRGLRNDKGHHPTYKNPPTHHYGKGNPHRNRHYRGHQRHRHYKGHSQRRHSVRKHVYHHGPKRHRRVEKHIYRHGPKRHRRVEKHIYRHGPKRHRHVEKHIYRHGPKRHRRVEKHVYHHVPEPQVSHGDSFNFAVSVVDDVVGFEVAVSSNR